MKEKQTYRMNVVESPCCGETGGCASHSIPRREFIRASSLNACIVMTDRASVMAGHIAAENFEKIIPSDKKWGEGEIASLNARGKALSAAGDDLKSIGMPTGRYRSDGPKGKLAFGPGI